MPLTSEEQSYADIARKQLLKDQARRRAMLANQLAQGGGTEGGGMAGTAAIPMGQLEETGAQEEAQLAAQTGLESMKFARQKRAGEEEATTAYGRQKEMTAAQQEWEEKMSDKARRYMERERKRNQTGQLIGGGLGTIAGLLL